MIKGVGKDQEIVTNKNGGKQSKSIGAFYLLDPDFFYGYFDKYYKLALPVIRFMEDNNKADLANELFYKYPNRLLLVVKTLEEGVERYPMNNWRLIPEESHLNHALTHLFAAEQGDKQDDHIAHFLTRMMMVIATEKETCIDNYTAIEKRI